GEQRLQRARSGVRDQHDSTNEVSAQFDLGQELMLIVDCLVQRHVKHGARGPAQTEAGKLCVTHYADDPECSGVLRQIDAEMLVKRFFIVLEETFYKSFIHHRYGLRVFLVGGGKASTTQNGNTEVFEVVRVHAVP